MGDLASLGVRWYVDDFGTGYSAISHLRDMPVSASNWTDPSPRASAGSDATAPRQLANGLVSLANGLALDTGGRGSRLGPGRLPCGLWAGNMGRAGCSAGPRPGPDVWL